MSREFDQEIQERHRDLMLLAEARDGAARLLEQLPARFSPQDVAEVGGEGQRTWEIVGALYYQTSRWYEARAIFSSLYQHMLEAQRHGSRVHKGMPLVYLRDCFHELGCPVHAKRYLMLTICEDAIREKGTISPETTGSYFRAVWNSGFPDSEFKRYAKLFWEAAEANPDVAMFPEALLQRVDDDWLTVVPSPNEAFVYFISGGYVSWLLDRIGSSAGKALEFLAEYLMSCMPGCRTRRRAYTRSTDYDVVCSMEGFEVDFRSELGRYFICECKDWATPADFTTMAKFCRVLDSFKARFGILFSRCGISGVRHTTDAAAEQLKVFQDRGVVVIALGLKDLELVARGANLIPMLRTRYEAVRLDIRERVNAATKAHDCEV